jgi:mono/diheme cytochrome c family protein
MKACCAALCVSALLIAWSASSAQLAPGRSEIKSKKPKVSVYNEIEKAPEKARAKRNPFEQDADALAAGKILFEQHCVECHGAEALGGKKAPSLRVVQVQTAKPGAIFWILTNGVVRRGMPVWSKLPEPQRWQLVTYVKSLGVAATEITPQIQPK